MRYAADRKAETRAKILQAASRIFRGRGYHASGVDKVMAAAGLTPGGFYAHFESKEALLAEALRSSGSEVLANHETALASAPDEARVVAFVDRYLSSGHRDSAELGCPIASLVSELSRSGEAVQQSFEAILLELAKRLDADPSRLGRTLAVIALCVGGIGLSRSVRDANLSETILESCRTMARQALAKE